MFDVILNQDCLLSYQIPEQNEFVPGCLDQNLTQRSRTTTHSPHGQTLKLWLLNMSRGCEDEVLDRRHANKWLISQLSTPRRRGRNNRFLSDSLPLITVVML